MNEFLLYPFTEIFQIPQYDFLYKLTHIKTNHFNQLCSIIKPISITRPTKKLHTDMSPNSRLIEKAQVLSGLRKDELCQWRIVIHKLCKTEIKKEEIQWQWKKISLWKRKLKKNYCLRLLDVERVMKLGIWRESDGAKLVRVVAYEKGRQVLDVSRFLCRRIHSRRKGKGKAWVGGNSLKYPPLH